MYLFWRLFLPGSTICNLIESLGFVPHYKKFCAKSTGVQKYIFQSSWAEVRQISGLVLCKYLMTFFFFISTTFHHKVPSPIEVSQFPEIFSSSYFPSQGTHVLNNTQKEPCRQLSTSQGVIWKRHWMQPQKCYEWDSKPPKICYKYVRNTLPPSISNEPCICIHTIACKAVIKFKYENLLLKTLERFS